MQSSLKLTFEDIIASRVLSLQTIRSPSLPFFVIPHSELSRILNFPGGNFLFVQSPENKQACIHPKTFFRHMSDRKESESEYIKSFQRDLNSSGITPFTPDLVSAIISLLSGRYLRPRNFNEVNHLPSLFIQPDLDSLISIPRNGTSLISKSSSL